MVSSLAGACGADACSDTVRRPGTEPFVITSDMRAAAVPLARPSICATSRVAALMF